MSSTNESSPLPESEDPKSIFEFLEDANIALVPNQKSHMYSFQRDGKQVLINFQGTPVGGMPTCGMMSWLYNADASGSITGMTVEEWGGS